MYSNIYSLYIYNLYSIITPRYSWNIAKGGIKHQSINHIALYVHVYKLLVNEFAHSNFGVNTCIRLLNEGLQFHLYQQSEQPRLASNSWIIKNTMTDGTGNSSPGLEQAQKCGRVKSVDGITTPLL